tara:strand:- start:4425 stop:6209 length:1785 start_codon:yes stop_codon:yes gene_type:complete
MRTVSSMYPKSSPQGFKERLSAARSERPLLIVVPGSGLIARCAVNSNADALMVLNAGIYRSLGTGSLASFLPFGNANDQTESLLREQILPRSKDVPVIAGVFAADQTQPLRDRLKTLQDLGVAGIVNWPAVGFVDGTFREVLESEGLGSDLEAEMLAMAQEAGFITFGFALGVTEVQKFIKVEVDALVLDVGLTRVSDDVRAKRDDLHRAITRLNQLSKAADDQRDSVQIVFGGPIVTPEDLSEVFRHTSIHGFAGGSVFERLPVRDVVETTVHRFKGVTMSQRGHTTETLGEMVGGSQAMRDVFQTICRVAPNDVTVCIEGESGTGKELVAALLHRLSSRSNHPFVTLNCGAIPESLLESELFGHEKGAFTGAERRRIGKFELAHGGTLFLDEIADLSPHAQVALLRVLQQREVTRVGGDSAILVDVRILAASNRPLHKLVAAGEFRADLYYRLNTICVQLPRLRDRLDDIPLLVETILADLRARLNREISGISSTFEKKLWEHAWPGNIRELEQVIHRSAILEEGSILEGWSFVPEPEEETAMTKQIAPPSIAASSNHRKAVEALLKAGGNKTHAAAALNVTRKTLYRWLKK